MQSPWIPCSHRNEQTNAYVKRMQIFHVHNSFMCCTYRAHNGTLLIKINVRLAYYSALRQFHFICTNRHIRIVRWHHCTIDRKETKRTKTKKKNGTANQERIFISHAHLRTSAAIEWAEQRLDVQAAAAMKKCKTENEKNTKQQRGCNSIGLDKESFLPWNLYFAASESRRISSLQQPRKKKSDNQKQRAKCAAKQWKSWRFVLRSPVSFVRRRAN